MEVQSEIIYGEVFEQTLSAYENGKKIIIHKGGTGSGKTEDIIIFLLFIIALKQSNEIITIVSESRPHLDIGAIRILKKYILKAGLNEQTKFNETSGRCVFSNGSIIEFFSADRIEKALGASGRVVVRYSGTESIVRVMVEGPKRAIVHQYAQSIASIIQKHIGV